MKNIPKTILFEHISKKSTHPLLGAWSILLVHIRFTPSEGPITLYLVHDLG